MEAIWKYTNDIPGITDNNDFFTQSDVTLDDLHVYAKPARRIHDLLLRLMNGGDDSVSDAEIVLEMRKAGAEGREIDAVNEMIESANLDNPGAYR